jgi:hypothetical protein
MKTNLNLSLLFYPSMSSIDPIYSIDIINDSLIIKKKHLDNKEYRGKLTDNQCVEIKKMVSALKKYDKQEYEFVIKGAWGCTLKVDNQICYEEDYFSFIPYSEKEIEMGLQKTPDDIKLLIDYIVSLSPIQIELYGFS